MLNDYFRSPYQKFLINPVIKRLNKRYSPNFLTFLAGLTGVLAFPALLFDQTFVAALLVVSSGYLDTLDGALARRLQKSNASGTLMDIMADRIVEAAIILGLFMVDPTHRASYCLVMLASCYLCVTSFLTVGILSKNTGDKSFYYSPGLIERPETFIFFTVMILVPALFKPLAVLFSSLVILTSIIRIYQFNKNLEVS